MGEFLSEQVEEWGLDDLGRAARVAPNPLRREAVNELIRRLSARRPARGDEAYIGGPPLPDDFDDDPLDTAPADEPVSGEGKREVHNPCENHPDREGVGRTTDGVWLCSECAPRLEQEVYGALYDAGLSDREGQKLGRAVCRRLRDLSLATHDDARSEVPPTFEAMMRSIGPVPPEMYRDLQEVWERHYSDLRRLSDRHEGEGEDDEG